MRSMPVVLVDPGREMTESMGGVLIAPGVGPLTNGGLDEALGFAVGLWGIDASADGLDLELAAGLSEEQKQGPLLVMTRRIAMPSWAKWATAWRRKRLEEIAFSSGSMAVKAIREWSSMAT